MVYDRTFRFSASHYGPAHHAIARACEDAGSMTWAEFKRYNAMLHGHNFVVRVVFGYDERKPAVGMGVALDANDRPVYGVWDQDIERVVMEWANCNISMHPDFYAKEWTSSTEAIAEKLNEKLMASFPPNVAWLDVTVNETDDIAVVTHQHR